MGYVVASVCLTLAHESAYCGPILCWRWPFLIEIICLSPLYLGIYLIPADHMAVHVTRRKDATTVKTTDETVSSSLKMLNIDVTRDLPGPYSVVPAVDTESTPQIISKNCEIDDNSRLDHSLMPKPTEKSVYISTPAKAAFNEVHSEIPGSFKKQVKTYAFMHESPF